MITVESRQGRWKITGTTVEKFEIQVYDGDTDQTGGYIDIDGNYGTADYVDFDGGH